MDPRRLKAEREKARELRASGWWRARIAPGICEYCRRSVGAAQLTMDHVVPLARGGKSIPGNVVPACRPCNADKRLETPVDRILRELTQARESK